MAIMARTIESETESSPLTGIESGTEDSAFEQEDCGGSDENTRRSPEKVRFKHPLTDMAGSIPDWDYDSELSAKGCTHSQAEGVDATKTSDGFCVIDVTRFVQSEGPEVAKKLARIYSSLGKPRAPQELRSIWTLYPNTSTKVLLSRGSVDRDIDRLADVAGILADIGAPALDSILEILDSTESVSVEFVEALLCALRWIAVPLTVSQQEILVRVLSSLSLRSDRDLREAAYETALRLPREQSSQFLSKAMQNETHPGAREVISEAQQKAGS